MEQNVSEGTFSLPPVDPEIISAFEWKDGFGTLPGSSLHFYFNEFGVLEVFTEAEAEAVRALTGFAIKYRSKTSSAPAADVASAASGTALKVPGEDLPCSTSQICEQMDCFENGNIATQTGSQQHMNSNGCQAGEAERSSKRLRRKRRLPLDSEEEEGNADEDEEKNKSNNMKSRRNSKAKKPAVPGKKKAWNWVSYLEAEGMPAAPIKLFKEYQSFPQDQNGFKVGMKLEGLDPEHCSLYCVLTVAKVQGYRMRLHFDGYSERYDFWVNADSWEIHPAGWCEKTGHKLLPPKGFKEGKFNWPAYLKKCKAQAAPKSLFHTLSTTVTPSAFRVGMKLEAVDRRNPSLICVASIRDVVDSRLLVHFDNWDESYDYWCEASSPYIHPVGYCQETGSPLTTPPGYKDSKGFSWEKYLEETNSQATPARAFKLRPAHEFQVNMKLEAVDRRNPVVIRVATVVDRDDYHIKIHFDGWDQVYDFWVDVDSPDIHPVGWCARTGHPLQVPPGAADPGGAGGQGCPTPGCSGIGHVRGPRCRTHNTLADCPYSEMNLNREKQFHDRLSGERLSPGKSSLEAQGLEAPAPFQLGVGDPSQEDSPQSRRSTQDSDKSCQSSLPSLLEQSAGNQKIKGEEEDSSADCKAKQDMLSGCSRTYVTYEMVKESREEKDPSLYLQQALHESIFMPSLASEQSHRMQLCWEKHCKILPEVMGLTAKHVATWTVEEVANFIQNLPGCKEQASIFREEQIDGEAFLLLNQSDIVKILNIKLGPALKICQAIQMFKAADDN